MVVLFGAAGEIRSRCYHTATRTAGTKRPTGAFFRFAYALFESLDTKKNTTLLGGVLLSGGFNSDIFASEALHCNGLQISNKKYSQFF